MLTDPSFVVPLIINAAQVNGTNTYPVNNPATNQKLWSATSATLDDVNAIAVSSAKALPVWKALKLTERRNFILKAGEVMEARAAEFKEAMQLETASDDLWCAFNINASIDMVKNVASRIWTLEGTIPETDDPAVTAMVLREPYGVVLAVAPWYTFSCPPHVLSFLTQVE